MTEVVADKIEFLETKNKDTSNNNPFVNVNQKPNQMMIYFHFKLMNKKVRSIYDRVDKTTSSNYGALDMGRF